MSEREIADLKLKLKAKENQIRHTDEDGWYQDLGKYKKKRALEVLDEIQNRIIKLSALEITGLNEKNASIYVKIFNQEKINNIKAVYEMPSE